MPKTLDALSIILRICLQNLYKFLNVSHKLLTKVFLLEHICPNCKRINEKLNLKIFVYSSRHIKSIKQVFKEKIIKAIDSFCAIF